MSVLRESCKIKSALFGEVFVMFLSFVLRLSVSSVIV